MNIQTVLKQQIKEIKPDKDTLKSIHKTAKDFCDNLKKKLKKKKIKADVFIGGSLAKNTFVKKKKQDIDVFIRFDEKYKDNKISKLLGKVLVRRAKKIHGSRDYYQINIHGIIFEIIPVIKIKKPTDAQNITDLSYFHVNYINKKIRGKKNLADEILLAKNFCHAQNCYGAESYIRGFSGYALELLICYYGSFLKFIRLISSKNNRISKNSLRFEFNNKIIIDAEKEYRNKKEILRELNEAKLQSPIILIDPTFKQRNALAGLSLKTFDKFRQNCRKFLRKPSAYFFKQKDISEELNKKYGNKLRIINVKTNKQAGDIAGTKSKKFFEFFIRRLEREFSFKIAEFYYDEDKNIAYFYFVLNKKKDEVIKGPPVINAHNLRRFKKAHAKAFIKNHFAYVKIKHNLNLNKFVKDFKRKDKKIIKQMCVKKVELVK